MCCGEKSRNYYYSTREWHNDVEDGDDAEYKKLLYLFLLTAMLLLKQPGD